MLYIKLFIEREKNIGQSAPECPFNTVLRYRAACDEESCWSRLSTDWYISVIWGVVTKWQRFWVYRSYNWTLSRAICHSWDFGTRTTYVRFWTVSIITSEPSDNGHRPATAGLTLDMSETLEERASALAIVVLTVRLLGTVNFRHLLYHQRTVWLWRYILFPVRFRLRPTTNHRLEYNRKRYQCRESSAKLNVW